MTVPVRWLGAFILFTGLAASPSRAADPSSLHVVASVPPIHSLVATIMQGIAKPRLLIPASASPHTFSLRPSDARALAGADIVVWVGPELETALGKSLPTLAGKARIVSLAQIPDVELLTIDEGEAGDDHGHGDQQHDDEKHGDEKHGGEKHGGEKHGGERNDNRAIDPHIWLSTDNARAMVVAIADALSKHDPANAAAYLVNRDAAIQSLQSLTARLRARLDPVRRRPFLVAHDSYRYFERQFGLEAIGAIAVSPDIRPGVRRLAELRKQISKHGARCIFAEPQFGQSLVRTVAEGTGARIGILDPLGTGLPAGPGLYPTLMENLAASVSDCLGAEG